MQTSDKSLVAIVIILLLVLGGVYFYSLQLEKPLPIEQEAVELEKPSEKSFSVNKTESSGEVIQAIFRSATESELTIESPQTQDDTTYSLSDNLIVKQRVTDPETYEYAEEEIEISLIPDSAPLFLELNAEKQVTQVIWLTY